MGFPSLSKDIGSVLTPNSSTINEIQKLESIGSVSLEQLGIVEHESVDELSKFPSIKGEGVLYESMAACEMIALVNNVPFRRDAIKKILEEQFRRDKSLSLELQLLTEAWD